MTTPLITATQLLQAIAKQPAPIVIDVRFDLSAPEAGEGAYLAGHVPGAHYAHLNRDLSGPPLGHNGRHPLPDFDAWRHTVAQWGVTPVTPVVVYDDHGGMFAARAWWLLGQLGHAHVSLLDGGLSAWLAAGGLLSTERPQRMPQAPAYPSTAAGWQNIKQAHEVLAGLGRQRLMDARAPERYRGDIEPLDAVAGHIPGAHNRFFKDNLGPQGLFKPPSVLKAEWSAKLEGTPPEQVIHLCGSGATACHNLLALAVAGLAGGQLYPGSWSEWCSDPDRPVARGERP